MISMAAGEVLARKFYFRSIHNTFSTPKLVSVRRTADQLYRSLMPS